MKALISILIIVGVCFGGYKLWEYYDDTNRQSELNAKAEAQAVSPDRLTGLPQPLEPSLKQAQQEGAKGLKAWLDKYRRSPSVTDPRLAWIELDYVVMISQEDHVEAKKVFAAVKKRTPPDSPVYRRVKELEKTYE